MANTLEQIIGQPLPNQPRAIVLPPQEINIPNDPTTKAQSIARNMATYFENPWAMIEDGVIWTHDEVDLLNPIKQFPNEPWLQAVTASWLNERLFAMYKSRRMKITWLMVFLHTWLATFNEGAAVYFVSDKEEKSDELVRRAAFILDHIPQDQVLLPAYKYSYCYLNFPGINSFIMGVPQGADQLRQYGATAIYDDEVAFWEKARETFMASKPTIDGGGRVTLTSSPKDGFFKELCFDLIR
jgi:phage FluMu gp28-like protein